MKSKNSLLAQKKVFQSVHKKKVSNRTSIKAKTKEYPDFIQGRKGKEKMPQEKEGS